MEYVLCMIMVYSRGDTGLIAEKMPIYGEYLRETKENVYQVNFTVGFRLAKVDTDVNIEYQWIDGKLCSWLKKGEIPK